MQENGVDSFNGFAVIDLIRNYGISEGAWLLWSSASTKLAESILKTLGVKFCLWTRLGVVFCLGESMTHGLLRSAAMLINKQTRVEKAKRVNQSVFSFQLHPGRKN